MLNAVFILCQYAVAHPKSVRPIITKTPVYYAEEVHKKSKSKPPYRCSVKWTRIAHSQPKHFEDDWVHFYSQPRNS